MTSTSICLILTLAFLPELYFAAYRTDFFAGPADEGIFLALRVSCGCLLFVSDFAFVCVFVSCYFYFIFFVYFVILPSDDVLC